MRRGVVSIALVLIVELGFVSLFHLLLLYLVVLNYFCMFLELQVFFPLLIKRSPFHVFY